MNKSKFDKKKVEHFVKHALENYKKNLIIDKITTVGLTTKSDGSYTQVAIRPLVDTDMFIAPNFVSELPGIGRIIAVGERDFLIQTLLEDKSIPEIELKKSNFTPAILLRELQDLNSKILMPSELEYYFLKDSVWIHSITYTDRSIKFQNFYESFFVGGNILKDKIIIIDESAIYWTKKQFPNEFTDTLETLEITLGDSSREHVGKMDITVRSINKLEYKREYVKIISLID